MSDSFNRDARRNYRSQYRIQYSNRYGRYRRRLKPLTWLVMFLSLALVVVSALLIRQYAIADTKDDTLTTVISSVPASVPSAETTIPSFPTGPLSGKIVVVDPGHGGFLPGTVGITGAIEKEINLNISMFLTGYLREAGATVIMTRETDVALSGSLRDDLFRRVEISNENNGQLFVSIHCNSMEESQWRGAQTFFHPDNEAGEALAIIVQQELVDVLGNTSRSAAPHDTTYILKTLTIPAIIVETGFLTNAEEEALLMDSEYQAKIARAVADGVIEYLEGTLN